MFRLLTFNNLRLRPLQISVAYLKDVVPYKSFENLSDKTKESYLEMIRIFETQGVHRVGHVEFIYSALRNMKEFNVEKDLDVYKALINVLPKGKLIPTNVFQSEFMHYPKQQQCAIDLLEQMEDNSVLPDSEVERMLLNVFGRRGFPLRKLWRIMYWMPKFRNLSPWPLPRPLPSCTLELAKLAVSRISSVDLQTRISVFQTKDLPDTIEDTWIVSAQSPAQRRLVSKHNVLQPMYVEGEYRVWIKNVPMNYFILRANVQRRLRVDVDLDDVSNIPAPVVGFVPSHTEVFEPDPVHEQADGVILSICITGTSSSSSLVSWVRHLERDGNHLLSSIPIVLSLRVPERNIEKVEASVVR